MIPKLFDTMIAAWPIPAVLLAMWLAMCIFYRGEISVTLSDVIIFFTLWISGLWSKQSRQNWRILRDHKRGQK